MNYKVGQRVKINKDNDQNQKTSSLNPPHVATIRYIKIDPPTGADMYIFKEYPYLGWFENEIDGLYTEEKPLSNKNLFEIIDLD